MSESRKYTSAQKQSAKKWDAANLDRLSLALPKGSKDTIKAHAEAHNESVNGFIGRAISETMERDTSQKPVGAPTEAANSLEGIIAPDTLKAAQAAAKATGENMPAFMARAVDRAVRTDEAAWSIGVNPATGKEIQKGDRKRK